MRGTKLLSVLICLPFFGLSQPAPIIKKIYDQALTNGWAYEKLDYLVNKIGARPSGSVQAAAAVEWAKQTLKQIGADTVYLQELKVPHWDRGEKENAVLKSNKLPKGSQELNICALGGSLPTDPGGISSKVIEVHNFDELKALGEKKIKGKIVFFNRPMDPTQVNTFHAYGGAVNQRGLGAQEAEKYGAIAVVVRSMTLSLNDYPHTGAMRWKDVHIPACAVSTIGANKLSEVLKQDPDAELFIKMNCHFYPDEISYNVIAEIKGSTHPDEIITVGGHLDSWDLGRGAYDDGTGVVQSMEVIKLYKSLGIKPERTVRVVLFMNEEFGLTGGTAYANAVKAKNEKIIAAIESDAGGSTPYGFSVDTTDNVVSKLALMADSLKKYGIYSFQKGGGGADIYTLKNQGALTLDLLPDSQRYFDYHHCAEDTFDKVNRRELELGAAAMASLILLLDTFR